eukprot:UN18065
MSILWSGIANHRSVVNSIIIRVETIRAKRMWIIAAAHPLARECINACPPTLLATNPIVGQNVTFYPVYMVFHIHNLHRLSLNHIACHSHLALASHIHTRDLLWSSHIGCRNHLALASHIHTQ